MSTRDEIVEQALALGPEDRAYVADKLEQSLSTGDFASPEIAAAWAVEIERRLEAYDRGEVQAIPVEESLEHMRRALEEHRRSRLGRSG